MCSTSWKCIHPKYILKHLSNLMKNDAVHNLIDNFITTSVYRVSILN